MPIMTPIRERSALLKNYLNRSESYPYPVYVGKLAFYKILNIHRIICPHIIIGINAHA